MDDLNFRAEFRRALDPIAPPAPWLPASVRDSLRERRRKAQRVPLGIRPGRRPAWLLPAVAALLAIALIVAVVAGSRLLRLNQPIPIRPPQHGLAGPAGCPGWSTNPTGGFSQASDRMTSRSDGWVKGGLRTTDGGAHWSRVVPDAMLSDAPGGTDPGAYPPAYVDFFLDSNHAWIAYGYPSAASCFDHVSVFSTGDGGRSWTRSSPVNAAIQADSSLQLQLDFIDARHGWMMVLAEGRLAPDWFVYSTSDGGINWQLVSTIQVRSSWCSMNFISRTIGFLGGCSNSSGGAQLTVTRDGGQTWDTVQLPAPFGSQFTVGAPVFFDQNRGVVPVTAQTFQGNSETSSVYLAVTDDGGRTWRAVQLSLPGYAQAFAFVDPTHFFAVINDGKGSTATLYRTANGGKTWSVVSNLPSMDQSYPYVMFLDSQHGFIDEPSQTIGEGPLVFLATNDGGRTWMDLHPQVS